MLATVLLAVPNVREGRDARVISELADAFAPARLLDIHSDPDHNRSVFTLAGEQGTLARALQAGARAAANHIKLRGHVCRDAHDGALGAPPQAYLHHEDKRQ